MATGRVTDFTATGSYVNYDRYTGTLVGTGFSHSTLRPDSLAALTENAVFTEPEPIRVDQLDVRDPFGAGED